MFSRVVAKLGSIVLTASLLAATGCKNEAPPAPKAAAPAVRFRHFDTPGAALEWLLQGGPRIIGMGELHEIEGQSQARSALWRFSHEMLAPLAKRSQALIVETWVTEGRCGEAEKKVVAEVAETTERPEHTEDELRGLLRRAQALGLRRRVLTMDCAEYARLLGPEAQEVELGVLLEMVGRKLAEAAETELAAGGSVAIYGGAIHNDLRPAEEDAAYSFGPRLDAKTGGAYLELDLYVPEYLESNARDDEALRNAPWYRTFVRESSTQRVLLIERAERSWILIFRRTVPGAAK